MTPVFPASNNDAMIEGEDVLAVNEEDERGDVHAANVEGDEEEHVPEANAEGNEEEHALAANAEHGEEETAEDVLIRRAIEEIQAEEATKGVPARADRANDEFNSPLHDDVNMYDAENNSYGAITEDDYEQVPEHRVDSVDTRDTTDDAYNAIEEYPLDDNIHGAGMSVKEVRAPHTRSRHVPGWEAYDY